MAENNDARVLLLFRRQVAATVGVEKAEDGLVRFFAAVILKRLDGNPGSVFFAKAVGELDFRVDAIIVANVSADKSDHNDGRGGG